MGNILSFIAIASIACESGEDVSSLDVSSLDVSSLDVSSLVAPSLDVSSLDVSSLVAPSLVAPSLVAPSLVAPSLDAPSLDAPSLDAPSLDASRTVVSIPKIKRKRKDSDSSKLVDSVPKCIICLECKEGLINVPCTNVHPSDHICNECVFEIMSKDSCPICRKRLKKIKLNLQPNAGEPIFVFWGRVVHFNHYAKGTLRIRNLITNNYVEVPFISDSIKRFRQYPGARYLYQIGNIVFDESDAIITIHEINEIPDRGGCFTGDAKLTVCKDGVKSQILLQDVVPGIDIEVACGVFCKVRNITVSKYRGKICVLKNGLRGTLYHPVFNNGKWIFMKNHPELTSFILYNGDVYNLQFEKGVTQGVLLNNISCTVLGHGVTDKKVDATLGHPFFGDWDKIDESLHNIKKDHLGRSVVTSFSSDVLTGIINGMH